MQNNLTCETCGAGFYAKPYRVRAGTARFCSYACFNPSSWATTHGHVAGGQKSREYRSWQSMHCRCRNQKNPMFYLYGGRGITVCDRWRLFDDFLRDMGPRPPGTSLDRINNALGYSATNCRWASAHEQQRNMRRNRWIEWRGKRQCLTDWSKELGIPLATIRYRLNQGMAPARVLRVANGAA